MKHSDIDLTRCLQSLHPGEIYNLAPPAYVERGFRYYRQGYVINITRKDDTIFAVVRGTYYYDVKVWCEDGNIEALCNCPAFDDMDTCKHVVAVILAIKNILEPGIFEPSPFDDDEREKFWRRLHLEPPGSRDASLPRKGLSLVFSVDDDDVFFIDDGEIIEYTYHLPQRLRHLSISLLVGEIKKNQIRDVGVETYLQYQGERLPVEYRERVNLSPKIYFHKRDGRFETTLSFMDRKGQTPSLLLFRRHILISPDEGWFTLIGGQKADTVEFFQAIMPGSTGGEFFSRLPITVSSEDMQWLILSPEGRAVVLNSLFFVDEREVDLYYPDVELLIDIVPEEAGGGVSILLRLLVSGEELPVSYRLLDFVRDIWLGRHGPVRSSLRRRNFFNYMVGQFTEGIKHRKQVLLRKLLDAFLQGRTKISSQTREKYRAFIADLAECLMYEEYNLTFLGERWVFFPSEIKQVLKILHEIYNLFTPSDILDVLPGASMIQIRRDSFYPVFPEFVRRLRDAGVNLTYRKKKIRQGEWDIAVEVQSGIDWFELRPEIRMNSRVISQEELRRLLDALSGNMVETEESVELLPENIEEALRILGLKKAGRKESRKREVFRIPRLQILRYLSLRKKGVELRLPPDEEEVIEHLLNFKGIRPVRLPSGLRATLRRYQKEGYYWLAFLYEHRFGACLADDMGLGKTIQTIALLGARREGIVGSNRPPLPHLIVVPPSLVFNWEHEIGRFYPDLRVAVYTGTDRQLALEETDIVITTYAIMRHDIDRLVEHRFDLVVFDEAQAIKNIHAATTRAARKLRGEFKLALTGTPVENHPGEYFSIIDLCLPGLMGDYDQFMKMYRQNSQEFMDDLIRRTAPFVLRRTKGEILKELPPTTEVDIYLDLTEKQKALYTRTVEAIKRDIDDAFATKTESQAQVVVLAALMKLRRLCLSPALVDGRFTEESPKIDTLVERLSLLREQGHSALVFSQFTSFLDLVEKSLRERGIELLRLDGSTPQRKRKELVGRFQEGHTSGVFLLSLKAGGQGLNLTRATYVFHLDPWWNPAVEQQATDRAHRIGQKRKVTVIRLLMRHSIEEKMQELKKRKKALYDALLGMRKSTRGIKLTREDIEFLLNTVE